MNTTISRVLVAPAATLAVLLALSGCAGESGAQGSSGAGSDSAGVQEPAVVQESEGFAISDAWVKATGAENTGTEMTGVFGVITNNTDTDFTIVSVSSEIAGMTELHETIVQSDGSSVMQELEGGATVPAGGDFVLEPGGNHIMLMMLNESILPGDDVEITVTTTEGDEFSFVATAREYTGAQETYAPESEHGGAHGGEQDHTDHTGDADHTGATDHTGDADHAADAE